MQLSDAQIVEFEEQGYLFLPGFAGGERGGDSTEKNARASKSSGT